MKIYLRLLCLLSVACQIASAVPYPNNSQSAAAKQINEWQSEYNRYILEKIKDRKEGCTLEKLQYRKEWGSLAKKDRVAYTTAVRCLQATPNVFSNSEVPGARSRFDDVIGTHIIQAPYIHFSGIFLHWHRYYTYLYDQILRSECGYTGPQPYWDWTLSYKDPRKSKIFDGSVDSMGSNGESIPHDAVNASAFGLELSIPPATGGGCVTGGPFTDYVVNLGPASYEPKVGDGSGLDYNPRCMKRDVSLIFANQTKPTDVVALIQSSDDFETFTDFFEMRSGVHAGGHFIIGGDPANDIKVSAGDPIFYLHHGQVDRLWTIWQALSPTTRFGKIFGTSTAFNTPPSPNVTLEYELQYNVLAPPQTIINVDSTVDGPFCYIYV